MTFLVPVSPHDVHLLRKFVDVLLFLGGLQKHQFLFCCAPSVHAKTAQIASELHGRCGNIIIESLPREPEGGWPNGCNMMFRDSIEIHGSLPDNRRTPFLWMELDVTPIRAGWADRLELEYNRMGKKALGVIRNASEVMRDANGQPTGEGQYMVGTCVYPSDMKVWSTLYRYPDPQRRIPFDISIRYELQRDWAHTDLIAHHSRTGGYERHGEDIMCKDHELQEGYPSYAGTINPMAILVHGCKDESLANLILGGQQTAPTAPSTPAQEQPKPAEATATDSRLEALTKLADKLEKENAELRQKLAQAQSTPAAKKAAKKTAKAAVTPKPADEEKPEDAITDPSLPTFKQVVARVAPSGVEGVRMDELAGDFGVARAVLDKHISAMGNGIEVSSGGLRFVSYNPGA